LFTLNLHGFSLARPQNRIFNPNWIWRGDCADGIDPKPGLSTV